jgi:hypothetical protein
MEHDAEHGYLHHSRKERPASAAVLQGNFLDDT